MKFRTGFKSFPAALALLLGFARAQAHDPFDASVRLTVRDNDIEATVTLGVDAARELLSATGFSREQITDLVRQRGPHSTLVLPSGVATNCFAMDGGAKPLIATNATLLSEGLEIVLQLTYPRPTAETLNVRAVFYEQIPQMRPGSFIAVDEAAHVLGSAQLSRASVTAKVPLPARKNPRPFQDGAQNNTNALRGSPSPLGGERAGVRGEAWSNQERLKSEENIELRIIPASDILRCSMFDVRCSMLLLNRRFTPHPQFLSPPRGEECLAPPTKFPLCNKSRVTLLCC
jgi:hypothetical protein